MLAAVVLVTLAAVTPAEAATITYPVFGKVIQLPKSANLGEPSLTVDRYGTSPTGNLYVTAPANLPSLKGSPVWTSTNRGASWRAPVFPLGDPVAGGDTDLVTDASRNLYQVDLWLGNAAMALSTDRGASFVANEWGHAQPGDDRPWLAYDSSSNTNYLAWDGLDGVHVGRTAALSPAQTGLLFARDVVAIPECALGACGAVSAVPVRVCVCPPGGIAVNQRTGVVFVTYSRQNGAGSGLGNGGVGISVSKDGGLTYSHYSIPRTGSTGSAYDTEWNFNPVAVDSQGTVYVAWGEASGYDPKAGGGAGGYRRGVRTKYAYSRDNGVHWSSPVAVSATGTSVFPTLDVVRPGVVDIGYYGTNAYGTAGGVDRDPNDVPPSASWDLDVTQVMGANTARPAMTSVRVVPGMHRGCIQSGGYAPCSDRSLLDFFQLKVDRYGMANIIFTRGSGKSTSLWFIRQVGYQTITTTTSTQLVTAGQASSGALVQVVPAPVPAPGISPAPAAAVTPTAARPDVFVLAAALGGGALLVLAGYRRRRRITSFASSEADRSPDKN